MKLVLTEPRFLKEPINVISELVNEARFKLDKDKLELIAMDPANVAMIIFKLLSSSFIEYNVDKEEEIAINLDNLKQVLKRAKPSDTITLETVGNQLKVELKGESIRHFNLSLINVEDKPQKIPELNFLGSVEIPTNLFNEAIEDMDVVAESVAFSVEGDKFLIEAAGNLHSAKVNFNKGEDIKINLSGTDKIKAKYSTEYLKKIIKGGKLSDVAFINFSNDYPLKVQYKVMDKVDLQFILAPRVSNEWFSSKLFGILGEEK